MSITNIQWTARHRIDPEGTCAHGATGAGRCLDVECSRCWVKGHTVNPWVGCEKVSAACKNCYAETVAENRMGINVWGKKAPRNVRAFSAVKELRAINRRAKKTGQRVGVFSGSMCDIFEDRADLVTAREIYLAEVNEATSVDLMLLTKRPENIARMVPADWMRLNLWPKHVWVGVTAEDQERWDERVKIIRAMPRVMRFVSVEPMLGPIDGQRLLRPFFSANMEAGTSASWPSIHAVIVGGESGGGARALDLAAAESLVNQCVEAGTAVFFKQMGSRWAQANRGGLRKGASHGQDPYRWPEWARRRELPETR